MYKAGAYPCGAIAPVQFLWQATPPSRDVGASSGGGSEDKATKLWIWCHPAVQEEVLFELEAAVKAYRKVTERLHSRLHAAEEMLSDSECPATECRACDGSASAEACPALNVTSRDLVRFRLIGPRSHALLMETLKPVWSDEQGSNSGCTTFESGIDKSSENGESEEPTQKWWLGEEVQPHLTRNAEVLAAHYPAIKSADNPAHFSRGAVIGMCVQDPRLFTPSKKTDMVSSYYPKKRRPHESQMKEIAIPAHADICNVGGVAKPSPDVGLAGPSSPFSPSLPGPSLPDILPPEVAYSSIWDPAVCDIVKRSRIPDHLLGRKRSEEFVRCSSLNLGDSAPHIPVLLIQQSPQGCPGDVSLATGWDLVLPPEYGMAFWVSLIYRGARVCGLNELSKCSVESRLLHFPQDFPDTFVGRQHNSDQRKCLEEEYLRKPPNKRINYGKFLVPTPFHIVWEDCVRQWSVRSVSGACCKGVKRAAENTAETVLRKKVMKLESGVGGGTQESAGIEEEEEGVSSKKAELVGCGRGIREGSSGGIIHEAASCKRAWLESDGGGSIEGIQEFTGIMSCEGGGGGGRYAVSCKQVNDGRGSTRDILKGLACVQESSGGGWEEDSGGSIQGALSYERAHLDSSMGGVEGNSSGSIQELAGIAEPLQSMELSNCTSSSSSKGTLEVLARLASSLSSSSHFGSLPTGYLSNEYHRSQGVYVLRSRDNLRDLKSFVVFVLANKASATSTRSANEVLQASLHNFNISSLLKQHPGALVAVEVTIHRSGNLDCRHSISLPSPSDLRLVLDTSCSRLFSGPVEELNQRGMTVVGKEGVVVGRTEFSRKEVKELRRRKKGEQCVQYIMSVTACFTALCL